MKLFPIHTSVIRSGDDIGEILSSGVRLKENDILVVSSKAVATAEGGAVDLSAIEVTDEARKWSERLGRTPAFRQAVLNEVVRLHGKIVGECTHAILTELKPEGLTQGTILAANAGLDLSNVEEGYVIGWPKDPVESAKSLRSSLKKKAGVSVAVLISDSCCRPRRVGVAAIALTASGIDPLENQAGRSDLFGRKLTITQEARADQLATAANVVMGNADQSIPAVVIRDHGFPLSDFEGWVPGIDPEEDLFRGIL